MRLLRSYLLLIGRLTSLPVLAQTNIETQVPASVTACGDPAAFTLTWYTNGAETVTNPVITVTMPGNGSKSNKRPALIQELSEGLQGRVAGSKSTM